MVGGIARIAYEQDIGLASGVSIIILAVIESDYTVAGVYEPGKVIFQGCAADYYQRFHNL